MRFLNPFTLSPPPLISSVHTPAITSPTLPMNILRIDVIVSPPIASTREPTHRGESSNR
jgi:hypothetical protein